MEYEDYIRQEVHDILSPESEFTRMGAWGRRGIVPIDNHDNPNSFVFFVTFGRSQGDHVFDEAITENGILTWQSQPSQGLENPVIQKLIAHNHLEDNIYLFLRTKRSKPNTYLGRLAYVEHDPKREKPVYFKWQILNWSMPPEKAREMGLRFIVDDFYLPEEFRNGESFFEGVKRQITVNTYERSTEARRKCIDHYGAQCAVCDFDFRDKYGPVGTGFIHVHHIISLSL